MKEPKWETCTIDELWKYVASHLARNGIETILVGGAVVSIYTDGVYQSGDLDFVLLTFLAKNLPDVMAQIGFRVESGRHYKHPSCKHLFVEFSSGPPGIGEDHNIQPAEVKIDGKVIKLYSPTDCIRDRLASYIHFKAPECLDQAVLVASRHPFDLAKVKTWCQQEGGALQFEEFRQLLKK